jgi:hypothetical protein
MKKHAALFDYSKINWCDYKNWDKSLLLLWILLLGVNHLCAQSYISRDSLKNDTLTPYLFITNRGDSLIGRVLDYTPPEWSIQLKSGDSLYYDDSNIKEIWPTPKPKAPISSRQKTAALTERYSNLFVSASAYSLHKGSRQLKNSQFILNEITFGATDHYNVSVGLIMPFNIVLKTKIATNNADRLFNVAAGANAIFGLPSFEDFPRAIHLYGAFTLGYPNKHINFNTGYATDLKSNNRAFIISGGGLLQLTDGWYILLDHLLLIKEEQRLLYPGVGLSYSKSNHRMDAGFFYFTNFMSSVINAPGIGYSYNF